MISLINFEDRRSNKCRINSPHSVEAMKRQGIRPNELLRKDRNEIKKMHVDIQDENILRLRTEHYEMKRNEKLRVCIEERERVVEDERNGLWAAGQYDSNMSRMNASHMSNNNLNQSRMSDYNQPGGLMDKEMANLEKMKQRQQRELDQMMEQEQKMQDMEARNRMKMEQQQMREQQRRQETEHAKRIAE